MVWETWGDSPRVPPYRKKSVVCSWRAYIAFVAVHGVHHEAQGRINQVARCLRVEVFEEGHRPLDVGEQGGDGLTLAIRGAARLERRLLGQNALGQMAR